MSDVTNNRSFVEYLEMIQQILLFSPYRNDSNREERQKEIDSYNTAELHIYFIRIMHHLLDAEPSDSFLWALKMHDYNFYNESTETRKKTIDSVEEIIEKEHKRIKTILNLTKEDQLQEVNALTKNFLETLNYLETKKKKEDRCL